MSHCRRDDDNECERDYWFRVGNDCGCRSCNHRPDFPRAIQANVIIPQTVIPVRIVFSPVTGTSLTTGLAGITSVGTNIFTGGGIGF